MKIVALQLRIIHSTAQLEHHSHNTMNFDLASTGSAQEKKSWGQGWDETWIQKQILQIAADCNVQTNLHFS